MSRTARSRRLTAAAVLLLAGSLATGTGAADAATHPSTNHTQAKPTVVLVHGAWADGASFGSIQARLTHDGYTVLTFANPLKSLRTDSADLNSFLKVKTTGPVILVGHSYGGAVITEAATTDPRVRGLVYIDAFVPDQGESVLGLATSATPGDPSAAFDAVPYAGAPAGDAELYLTKGAFDATFATGLPKNQQQDLFARQEPVTLGALSQKATAPAWKTLPSWYVAGTDDKSIPLALQQKMATRAHSQVTTVKAGHLAMLQHPATITHVIEEAATSTR
ncbi:alpha/beta fold hydrolase [Kineococcus sp. GCM10028916]|uniref:alpha/beta fold hydrolase n=1 Tax=Kineococcus sp. GCM10028916 TaxID=3273394 RepID=UPI00362502C6